MFDFAWTEIALVGVVALIAIGPKDLPAAIKTVAGFVKKARKMAGEFQGHVDEMVREANLSEVRDQLTQLRNFDIKGEIEKAVDSDGSLRATLNDNPLASPYDYANVTTEIGTTTEIPAPVVPPLFDEQGRALDKSGVVKPEFIPPEIDFIPEKPKPPAFIPPETKRPYYL